MSTYPLQTSAKSFDGIPATWKGNPLRWCWRYLDRDGATVLGMVARYDGTDGGKDVVPFFKPDGQDHWKHGHVQDDRRPLYGLHSLKPGAARVYLVEGEKCAAALHCMGVAALTSPGGCKAAERADWTPLDGIAEVIILPDHDSPGDAYCNSVAGILAALPNPPKVYRAELPGLPEKGDVVDWLQERFPDWDGFDPLPRQPGDDLEDEFREAVENAMRPLARSSRRAGRARGIQAPSFETVCLADVEPETVRWLWHGYLPAGKLVILDGDPCVGKSTLTLDWISRLSKGEPFPRCNERNIITNTLFLYTEDGLGDTLRPRLDAAGADVSRVHALKPGDFPQLPDALDWIRNTVAAKDIGLIVIDPLMALLGGCDTNSDAKVRNVLTPLMGLAEETGITIVAVRHLTKALGRKAIHAGGGSVAFTAAARVVLTAARAPDESGRCVLAVAKCNLCPKAPSLFYELNGADGAPRIVWGEPCDLSADDLMPAERKRTEACRGGALEEAITFLECELSDGALLANEIESRAKGAGISLSTLRRASGELDVRKLKSGFAGGAWMWKLPEAC